MFFLAIPACTSDSAKNLPKDIIGEDKMKEIYKDVFITESAVLELHLLPDSTKKLMQVRYEQIALRHHVKRKQMLRTMQYYSRHPQILSETLQPVIDSLSAMEARLK